MERERFAIICPSRGRPWSLRRLAQSIARTAANADLIAVLDVDDQQNYPRLPGVQYVVGPRVGFVGSSNLGLRAACGYGYIGCVGDDVVFRTPRWDEAFIAHMQRTGPAICYGNDLFQSGKLSTHWFVSAPIVHALGWIALPDLIHLYADNVWMAIGTATRRLKYFEDIIIEHLHYSCGKAPFDETYEHPSAIADAAAYERFEKSGLQEVVEKLSHLLGEVEQTTGGRMENLAAAGSIQPPTGSRPNPHPADPSSSSLGSGFEVSILHEIDGPRGGGAFNGMWALQQALCRRIHHGEFEWLSFSRGPVAGSIPWIWCWQERDLAARLARDRAPFILGPNVVFEHSLNPRCDGVEEAILDATSCLGYFCHSSWYRRLLRSHLGPGNHAPIWCWPYPVRPLPEPPCESTDLDVLVFLKSGPDIESLAELAVSRFPRSRIIRYGGFRREEFYELARRARSCLYLSVDESGGLATQELMMAGCPVAGIERGAPLIEDGSTGIRVADWDAELFVEAIERCLQFDRNEVRRRALRSFDEEAICSTVVRCLESAKRSWEGAA